MVEVIEPLALTATEESEGAAVEFEARVPPSGEFSIVSGRQSIALHRSTAGRTVTVWADLRSIHVLVDGHVARTVASRLIPDDPHPAGDEGRPARRSSTGPARAAPPERNPAPS
ncbi:hypothetical protein [Haloactinospora alba]|uniref:hypothetical protein n=1 Tax=Haloactinospora alba TaxID=405555 RepID=UPI0014774EBA|nr:hypothetical protein [Haloactinospora alba]